MRIKSFYLLGMLLAVFTACNDSKPLKAGATPATVALPAGGSTTISCEAAVVCPEPPVCLPACGDKTCNGTETCSTCPGDCGVCPPVCGDKTCNGTETCSTCPGDCGVCPPSCGDKTCNGTETCTTCPGDCGVCPPSCGDKVCNGTETCSTCAGDCGICPATSFTFTAAGDIGRTADSTAVLKSAPSNGEFLFMLGDLSYEAPPETNWCNYVKTNLGTHPVQMVSGNHESVSTYNNGLIDNFVAAGCLPNRMPNVTGVYGKEYYFDYPATAPMARFIAVSPELPFENPTGTYSSKKGTVHYNWAVSAIDSARAAGIKWVIVTTHRPCLTVGEKSCEMGAEFFNMLVEKKVDLVLMGHDHSYQRSKQLALGTNCTAITPNVYNANCIVNTGAGGVYAKGKGPVFVINGTGGRASYAVNASDPEINYMAAFTAASTHGLSKVKVTADTIDVDFVRASGTTYSDHFSITSLPPPVIEPETVSVPVTELTTALVNPERGFYKGLNLIGSATSAVAHYSAGHTIDLALIDLSAYRSSAIPQTFLDGLTNGFKIVRSSGMKVILRFRYSRSLTAPTDAPLSIVLQHIAQLAPIVVANADVIAVQQAGFIGAWGEWHHSSNGLDTPANMATIAKAILAALPANRFLQIRTPMQKDSIFPGGPLTAAETTDKGRVGHHNDCFLASDSDMGTYTSPYAFWKGYVAQDGRFTPVGGETCAVFPTRTDCTPALAELRTNHWSYLNIEYNTDVLNVWKTQGCYDTVTRFLGYHLALTRVVLSEEVKPGGILQAEFDITNRGFAAPFNSRPVYLKFTQGTSVSTVFLPVDPRTWQPGVTTLKYKIRVPANITPGMYEVSLWMPDAAMSLRGNPKYEIKLANAGNLLTASLPISANANGASDPAATVFSVIP